MPIVVNLDVMLARRKMRLNELADRVGITAQNLSVLKTGRARAIRFTPLERLGAVLDCQPGVLFAFGNSARDAAADTDILIGVFRIGEKIRRQVTQKDVPASTRKIVVGSGTLPVELIAPLPGPAT